MTNDSVRLDAILDRFRPDRPVGPSATVRAVHDEMMVVLDGVAGHMDPWAYEEMQKALEYVFVLDPPTQPTGPSVEADAGDVPSPSAAFARLGAEMGAGLVRGATDGETIAQLSAALLCEWPRAKSHDEAVQMQLEDWHANYHDQPGNMMGRNDCGWQGCDFFDSATFVLAALGAPVRDEVARDS